MRVEHGREHRARTDADVTGSDGPGDERVVTLEPTRIPPVGMSA